MISEHSFRVACEHVRWCRIAGMSPVEIIDTFGPRGLKRPPGASLDDAIWVVALAFHKLPRDGPLQLAA